MGFFVRKGWERKVLTMADLDEALCRVMTTVHVESPKYADTRDILERVVGFAEYLATELPGEGEKR